MPRMSEMEHVNRSGWEKHRSQKQLKQIEFVFIFPIFPIFFLIFYIISPFLFGYFTMTITMITDSAMLCAVRDQQSMIETLNVLKWNEKRMELLIGVALISIIVSNI